MSLAALAASPMRAENAAPADAGGRTEPQGRLPESWRRARQDGAAAEAGGGGQSLSERLKNISAEAPDS